MERIENVIAKQQNSQKISERRAKNKLDEDNNMYVSKGEKNILTFSRGFGSMFCTIQMCCRSFFLLPLTMRFFPSTLSSLNLKEKKIVTRAQHLQKKNLYNQPMNKKQPPIFICILNKYFHFRFATILIQHQLGETMCHVFRRFYFPSLSLLKFKSCEVEHHHKIVFTSHSIVID